MTDDTTDRHTDPKPRTDVVDTQSSPGRDNLKFPPPRDHQYNSNPPANYDPIPLTDRSDHPVCQSEFVAWKVLLAPSNHDAFYRTALFKRGLEHYRTNTGDIDTDQWTHEVQQFALTAATDINADAGLDDPWLHPQEPGRLAVLYAGAALAMKHSPALEAPPFRISFQHKADEALYANVLAMLRRHPRGQELFQFAGETVFGRTTEDDRGPPPGRTVTDLVEFDDGSWYFEIPLTHASRHALARDRPIGPSRAFVTNNCAYVPYDVLDSELESRFLRDGTVSTTLRTDYHGMYRPETFNSFLHSLDELNQHIEQIKQTNRLSMLYKDQRYPEPLRCVLKIIREAPADMAVLDKPVTAGDVLEAIQWAQTIVPSDADNPDTPDERHDTITEYEQSRVNDLDTPEGVTTFLKKHSDHDDVTFIQQDHPKPNQFILSFKNKNIVRLDIEQPDDIFELPCVANLEDYFMNHPPIREPLYFLVRIMASVENNFSREELCDVFTRFPWYDQATTWYQVGYELRQDALPIGCHNDNTEWERFCIGIENCDYSIYGSLPMRQDVLDKVGDQD
jgi:hypothetical protein